MNVCVVAITGMKIAMLLTTLNIVLAAAENWLMMGESFDMKIKYRGTLRCTIDQNHPDIKYVDNWTKDKVFEFSDEYTFDYDEDYIRNGEYERYIKRDLSLVAGGGYNAEHIHNVAFEIQRA